MSSKKNKPDEFENLPNLQTLPLHQKETLQSLLYQWMFLYENRGHHYFALPKKIANYIAYKCNEENSRMLSSILEARNALSLFEWLIDDLVKQRQKLDENTEGKKIKQKRIATIDKQIWSYKKDAERISKQLKTILLWETMKEEVALLAEVICWIGTQYLDAFDIAIRNGIHQNKSPIEKQDRILFKDLETAPQAKKSKILNIYLEKKWLEKNIDELIKNVIEKSDVLRFSDREGDFNAYKNFILMCSEIDLATIHRKKALSIRASASWKSESITAYLDQELKDAASSNNISPEILQTLKDKKTNLYTILLLHKKGIYYENSRKNLFSWAWSSLINNLYQLGTELDDPNSLEVMQAYGKVLESLKDVKALTCMLLAMQE